MQAEHIIKKLEIFVFWYPFIMALFWIAGSKLFPERHKDQKQLDFDAIDWPEISILVPCYNEEDTIKETIANLCNLAYPKKEIIAVNDGSSDQTGKILQELALKYDNLKVIDCKENRGKATALKLATFASKTEYLLCVDSDALLDTYAAHYLIFHFIFKGERLGAVTGNPRIRNRDTLLAKLQVVEYASIIGAIKRSQRVLGRIMTVSGVIVAFRKKALIDICMWDHDMITEDISVSWKLYEKFWDIRYEPRALCWMLVPETLGGIWRQRVRWAQGGQEVIIRHWKVLLDWRYRRVWLIYLEQWVSLSWVFAWTAVTAYYFYIAQTVQDTLLWLAFPSFALVFLSLIQLGSSLKIDNNYDNVSCFYLWAAWYPFIYWVLNAITVIYALPKAVKSRFRGGYAVWTSPDRGQRKSV